MPVNKTQLDDIAIVQADDACACWFHLSHTPEQPRRCADKRVRVEFRGVRTSADGLACPSVTLELPRALGANASLAYAARHLSDAKLGELGCFWDQLVPIEYRYAKIKLGDLFEFYTTSDGVLRLPRWSTFKYVVDQYLDEAPRVKYHPNEVCKFVEANGVEKVETME